MGDIQDEDVPTIYSQEEINSAREDLKNMTPEDLLSLRGALDRAMANISMPEAVSIAFTEVYTQGGNKVNITCRGVSGRHAIDELADTLRYMREKYDMRSKQERVAEKDTEIHYVPNVEDTNDASLPYAPQPTYSPQPTLGQIIDMAVVSITRERKRDGKGDVLHVRGGPYTKFGVAAYENVWPQTLDRNKFPYGQEITTIPSGMTNAKVNTQKPGVKVVAFY
jgi:hypothetical protein